MMPLLLLAALSQSTLWVRPQIMQLATQLKLEMEMEMKTRNEKQPSRKLSACAADGCIWVCVYVCLAGADWPELLPLSQTTNNM